MDYELRRNTWEDTEEIVPVRKAKKPKKKKKNPNPSVTGSVRAPSPTRSVNDGARIPSPNYSMTGRALVTPIGPARSVNSRNSNRVAAQPTSPSRLVSSRNSNRGTTTTSPTRSTTSRNSKRSSIRETSPARSISSTGGKTRSGHSSVWGASGAPSRAQSVRSPSSVIAPSEYDDPWGDNRRSSYVDNFYSEIGTDDEERDEDDEAYEFAAFSRPLFYDNGDPAWEEADPHEGPDGLRRENEGVRLERLGAAPNGHYRLSERRSENFDRAFFGPRGVNLRHIAQKTNTYIGKPENDSDPEVNIWGRPDQVSLAIENLMLLSEHIFLQISLRDKQRKKKYNGRPGERKKDWAKVKAQPTERKQRYLDQEKRKEERCRQLRRPPPKTYFEFNAIGAFWWPKEPNAQDHLGASFERLDGVRVDHDVWIVPERRLDGYMFQILGEDQESVDKALSRLYGAFCAAAAKNRTQRIMDKHLIHPPSMNLENTRVSLIKERELENYQVSKRFLKSTKGVRALLVGEFPSWEFVDMWKTKRETLERANDRFIKKIVNEGLKDIVYFRGYASLKINFGTLVLFGYKEPPPGGFSIEDFSRMVRDTMTASELIKYIGKEHTAKALIKECHARKDLFHHVDRGHSKFAENPYSDFNDGYEDLHDIQDDLEFPNPSIEATFECTITNGAITSKIRLEIEFERIPGKHPGDMANAAGEHYRVGTRRWLFLEKGANSIRGTVQPRQKGPIDIKVLDLEADLAWQMELNTYEFCPDADAYPIFSQFVRKIRIEEIPDESDPLGPPRPGRADSRRRVKRISYVNLPELRVEKIVQKTKYQYWLSRTPYKFEITQYETFFPEKIGPSNLSLSNLYAPGISVSWKGLATYHDDRWGASLIHVDWAHNLSQQSLIQLGCPSDWEPDVDSFFKSSGIGGFNDPVWTRDKSFSGSKDPWNGDGWRELLTRVKELTKFISEVRKVNLTIKETGYAGPEEFDE